MVEIDAVNTGILVCTFLGGFLIGAVITYIINSVIIDNKRKTYLDR
jgi:phage shock protein PspC (stress-responsive transcriptional regulator)